MKVAVNRLLLRSVLIVVGAYSAPADLRAQSLESPASESATPSATSANENRDLLDLNLEQLSRQDVVAPALDVMVTSVSRQESTVGRSPAAVFVITPEMIRRSGATCIPEVLRMAPGLDVARISSDRWAISARGFNAEYGNKLLVQIDRRVVYSALFGGVYWDVQDVVLQDVDRIEVIRGPGTVAWGSNAVNGVINIYTKKAKDTQGALVAAGGGNQEQNFTTTRYGGKIGDDFHWRVYGKEFERNHGYDPNGAFDDWRQARAGFRGDWTLGPEDNMTFQGDAYNGMSGQQVVGPTVANVGYDTHVQGGNALYRWTKTLDDDHEWQFQTYFDNQERHDRFLAQERNTFDVDFQSRRALGFRHHIVYGGNYRLSHDDTGNAVVQFTPRKIDMSWASLFVEDRFTLIEDRWYAIGGTRVEYNTFGKVQPQPTARLLFLPDERRSCWAAVSRAARNPTRVENGLKLSQQASGIPPVTVVLAGNPQIAAEHMMAYELGYRAQPVDFFSWDIATYFNDYQDVVGTVVGNPFFSGGTIFIPTTFANNVGARSAGAELSATVDLTDDWRLTGAYTFTKLNAYGDSLAAVQGIETSTPRNQLYLRSSWDLTENVDLDLMGRYVDSLGMGRTPAYNTADLRLAWRPTKNAEIAVVGQNLFAPRHLEFGELQDPAAVATQVPRGVYGSITWRR